MSAPNNSSFAQPHFSQAAAPGTEPTNAELDRMEALTQTAARNRGIDRAAVISFIAGLCALVGSALLLIGSLGVSTTQAVTPSPTAESSSLCELGQVEVRTVEGDSYTDSYCATQAEYEALVAEAEGQYAAALKNGKLVYQDWLTDRKLSPKTEKARETAAQKYLCQTSPDFGDGALYAATKAGLPESELNFAIGNALITIDGYDPTDQACSNGKPVPRPNPPQPKDPSRDPATNGNAPSDDGRNVPYPELPAPTMERPGQPGELQDP